MTDHPHSHDHGHSHAHGTATTSEQHAARKQATIVAAFDRYRAVSLSLNHRRRTTYYALSRSHQLLLSGHLELLKEVDDRIRINAEVVERFVANDTFGQSIDDSVDDAAAAPTSADHERLRSTLRQCVRDWSLEGKDERDAVYHPMIEALKLHYSRINDVERAKMQVLVPGAGLGRLAWEAVNAGFSCQANEFSLYMLIVSNYILNDTAQENQLTIYPFIHSFSNSKTSKDTLRSVSFPDVLPSIISFSAPLADFSFAAGDFLEVYGATESIGRWNAILTCFFLDTAKNVIDYLELIYKLLAPDGIWINCGPTLWHFENADDSVGGGSIELSVEELKDLARRVGFTIEDEKEIETSYTGNRASTLHHQYTASFWVAKKVIVP